MIIQKYLISINILHFYYLIYFLQNLLSKQFNYAGLRIKVYYNS